MELTDKLDLRSGRPVWPAPEVMTSDPLPDRCDIAIVGAGIMGAMLADRLSQDGHDVVLLDRRSPAHGSTAASTALVQWAADTPLLHLTRRWGAERAVRSWRLMHRAVVNLDADIRDRGLACDWERQPELYLSGNLLDEAGLRTEGERRRAAGLPSRFMEGVEVSARFNLPQRAGLLSEDAFGLNPVALTQGLLERAKNAGAAIVHPIEATGLEQGKEAVSVRCSDGTAVRASHVILASGYEISPWFLPEAFTRSSTFAVATAPGTAPTWQGDAMIWEAADPYLYARRTSDDRILIGGGDIPGVDSTKRDALLPTKQGWLEAQGARLLGVERLRAEYAWAAVFGSSPDGLPALGRAANTERIWLAYGFGGNGITFARLAAELLPGALAGAPDGDLQLFDPYRFET
ncbi:NAD(P)/FAD-dependent oxidoreductase [Brevundimonas faecalis]|uniref:NAD(P)/FAD-dependent oxidoreductase n=1 Tax=Brevundimonas faecalis TaxID=947378 RepID=UPI003608910F